LSDRLTDVAAMVAGAVLCVAAFGLCSRFWWWLFAGRHRQRTAAALKAKRAQA
jgi:hypothetical protein